MDERTAAHALHTEITQEQDEAQRIDVGSGFRDEDRVPQFTETNRPRSHRYGISLS